MKALVLEAPNRFVVKTWPMPVCGEEDVLIRVKACAICGSDVHGMDGSTGRRIPPIIMGHEAAGVIEKVGTRIANWNVGDRVTFDSTVFCGKCSFCTQGLFNLCDYRKVLGVSCDDYRLHGALAEYVSVPARILYGLPNEVSFEKAAMIEPLAIAMHALNRSAVGLSDTAVVIGSGMIGLLIIQLLKRAGCATVIAVDMLEEKLEMALGFGADYGVVASNRDVSDKVRAYTDGFGADHAYEVVGLETTLMTAVACVKKGGAVTLVGNLRQGVSFPLQEVVTRQITLYGSCASAGEYPQCLDLIAKGRVDVDSFISDTAPLEEAADRFARLYKKEKGLYKVIIKP